MSVMRIVSNARSTVVVRAAGEELLDLGDERLGVADAGQVVDAVEFDVAGAGDPLGHEARVAHVDGAVASAVQDQGGQAQPAEVLARVVLRGAAPERAHGAGAGRESRELPEPCAEAFVVGSRGSDLGEVRGAAPTGERQCDLLFRDLPRRLRGRSLRRRWCCLPAPRRGSARGPARGTWRRSGC